MHRVHVMAVSLLAAIVTTGAAGTSGAPASADPSAPDACPMVWQVVPSPNVGSEDNGLADLAVVDATDIWSIGSYGSLTDRHSLTLHWDGAAWQTVSSPDAPGKPVTWMTAADALATDDVWAVGYGADEDSSSSLDITLAEHWDGASWTVVPTPNPQPNIGGYPVANQLRDASAVAPDDVWAVGQSYTFSGSRPLVEHWDGASWTAIPAPYSGMYSRLDGVHAVSADDVWAVGSKLHRGLTITMIEHWDGHAWSIMPSPNDGPYVNELFAVDGSGPDDVWAAGHHLALFGASQVYQTTTLHWDGTAWSVVDSQDVNQLNNRLFDVASASDGQAWTVGLWDTGSALRTLVEQWDGSAWSISESANAHDDLDELDGVAAVSPTDVWAVGQTFDLFNWETLITHLTATCPTMHVNSVTPFVTPSGSTVGATIEIGDQFGIAVTGARVEVVITEPDGTRVTKIARTSDAGRGSVGVPADQIGTYRFSVTGLTAPHYIYDRRADVERTDTIDVG